MTITEYLPIISVVASWLTAGAVAMKLCYRKVEHEARTKVQQITKPRTSKAA